MQRTSIPARDSWEELIQEDHLTFSQDSPRAPHYWDEFHAYNISSSEYHEIESISHRLNGMAMALVDRLVNTNQLSVLNVGVIGEELIRKSWRSMTDHDPAYYGRFDFYKNTNGEYKLLEFNADTPTTLPESAIAQKNRIERHLETSGLFYDRHPNTLMKDLTQRWAELLEITSRPVIHMACLNTAPEGENWDLEDEQNITVHAIAASEAGWDVRRIFIDDLCWDSTLSQWYEIDSDGVRTQVTSFFNIYPWEDMVTDTESENTDENYARVLVNGGYEAMEHWFEPPWKMCLSNKMLLPLMWEMFPGDPNLVESLTSDEFEKCENRMRNWVKKPLFGREGLGVTIHAPDYGVEVVPEDDLSELFSEEDYIYQEYIPPARFDDQVPMVGAWIVHLNEGETMPALSIRDTSENVTNYYSTFTPYLVTDL